MCFYPWHLVHQHINNMAQKTKSKSRSANGRAKASARKAAPAKKTARPKAKEDKTGSMLADYFMDALKDIYWAEKALTKALPKMAKNATSKELKKAFETHLEETKKQIERLEQVFEKFGKKAQSKKCEAMNGLIEESESIMAETKDDTATRDAALIISAQKAEHYEIATYGGLVQLAKTLGKPDVAKILETTLNEEKKTDELLTKIAENSGVNEEASDEKSEKSGLKENIMSIFS
jgi:ferritin-like metal-binding protein YciE